jgi:hypothetical protein
MSLRVPKSAATVRAAPSVIPPARFVQERVPVQLDSTPAPDYKFEAEDGGFPLASCGIARQFGHGDACRCETFVLHEKSEIAGPGFLPSLKRNGIKKIKAKLPLHLQRNTHQVISATPVCRVCPACCACTVVEGRTVMCAVCFLSHTSRHGRGRLMIHDETDAEAKKTYRASCGCGMCVRITPFSAIISLKPTQQTQKSPTSKPQQRADSAETSLYTGPQASACSNAHAGGSSSADSARDSDNYYVSIGDEKKVEMTGLNIPPSDIAGGFNNFETKSSMEPVGNPRFGGLQISTDKDLVDRQLKERPVDRVDQQESVEPTYRKKFLAWHSF